MTLNTCQYGLYYLQVYASLALSGVEIPNLIPH